MSRDFREILAFKMYILLYNSVGTYYFFIRNDLYIPVLLTPRIVAYPQSPFPSNWGSKHAAWRAPCWCMEKIAVTGLRRSPTLLITSGYLISPLILELRLLIYGETFPASKFPLVASCNFSLFAVRFSKCF